MKTNTIIAIAIIAFLSLCIVEVTRKDTIEDDQGDGFRIRANIEFNSTTETQNEDWKEEYEVKSDYDSSNPQDTQDTTSGSSWRIFKIIGLINSICEEQCNDHLRQADKETIQTCIKDCRHGGEAYFVSKVKLLEEEFYEANKPSSLGAQMIAIKNIGIRFQNICSDTIRASTEEEKMKVCIYSDESLGKRACYPGDKKKSAVAFCTDVHLIFKQELRTLQAQFVSERKEQD